MLIVFVKLPLNAHISCPKMKQSRSSLIMVCTICSDLSVPIFKTLLHRIKLFENDLYLGETHIFSLYEFRISYHLQFERSMAYTVCHAPLSLYVRRHYRSVTNAIIELPTVVLSSLTEDGLGARQIVYAMPAKFSVTLVTEILSAETSGFLKQTIFCKSINTVFYVLCNHYT